MIPHLGNVSRTERREMLRQLDRDNKQWPKQLCAVPEESWPQTPAHWRRPIAVYRSRDFLVQVFDEGAVIRLSVSRTSVDEVSLRWRDDISWDDLQRLKSEAGYGEREAVEIYPPDGDVVNVGNLRHLWVLHARLPFSWVRKP